MSGFFKKKAKIGLIFREILALNIEGIYIKQKNSSINEHLASLSVQYGCYPAELFQALVTARAQSKASCQNLSVEYRGNVDNEAIFLIKQDGVAMVQFRVPDETLQQKNLAFDDWMESDRIRKQIAKQNPSEPTFVQIQNLRSGMKKVNLDATVLETPKPKQVHTQFGNLVMMANTYVEDETGKIKLCLWDQQIGSVREGDVVQLRNASVATFKGEKQLRLGKNGTLAVIRKAPAGAKPRASGPKKVAKKIVCA